MASNYTGDPTAAESPSPAPSLGESTAGDPIGNLPADGDTLNVSSVLQALKVPLDWIAFFRRQGYGWTDISADVTVTHGTAFGYKRTIGSMTVVIAGATGLTNAYATFTMTIGGSRIPSTLIALATGQSTDASDEPFYAKAHESSGSATERVYAVYHDTVALGATAAVQVLILSY